MKAFFFCDGSSCKHIVKILWNWYLCLIQYIHVVYTYNHISMNFSRNLIYLAKEEENHDSQPMDTIAPPLPPSSGYTVGKMMPSVGVTQSPEMTNQKKPGRDGNKSHKPRIRPNRMKVMGTDMPTEEQLLEVKRKKKVCENITGPPIYVFVPLPVVYSIKSKIAGLQSFPLQLSSMYVCPYCDTKFL